MSGGPGSPLGSRNLEEHRAPRWAGPDLPLGVEGSQRAGFRRKEAPSPLRACCGQIYVPPVHRLQDYPVRLFGDGASKR